MRQSRSQIINAEMRSASAGHIAVLPLFIFREKRQPGPNMKFFLILGGNAPVMIMTGMKISGVRLVALKSVRSVAPQVASRRGVNSGTFPFLSGDNRDQLPKQTFNNGNIMLNASETIRIVRIRTFNPVEPVRSGRATRVRIFKAGFKPLKAF